MPLHSPNTRNLSVINAEQPPIEWPVELPKTCTQGMLITAVRLWAKFAPDALIAQYLNVQPAAVKRYTSSLWWAGLVSQLRDYLDADIEHAFGRIGFRAMEQLEDRLMYGDYYITRDGQRARRPLAASELIKISTLALDNRSKARALVEGTTAAADSGSNDLAALATLLRNAAVRQQKALEDARTQADLLDNVIDITAHTPLGQESIVHAPHAGT